MALGDAKHVITLEAKDNVSAVLDKVGNKAKEAGKKAEDATKGASRATQDWSKAASAVGTVLGVGFAAAIKLSNESEVAQSRLKQSIENTGVAYSTLKGQIDDATGTALDLGFDDEDALNALNTLTNATGDAEQAILDLALAEDIARGRGISLGEAANIVAAAEQGRIGVIRRMGIAIDENATKEQTLDALRQKFSGQAETYARTNAATWDRFGNKVENVLESMGGALGDVQGPLMALGGAGVAIGPLGDAFTALGGKAKLASIGASAMNLALGPVGLAAFAVTAAAGIAYLALTQDDAASAAELAADANKTLNNTLADQATQLDRLGLLSAAEGATDFLQAMIADAPVAATRLDDLNKVYEKLVLSGTKDVQWGDERIQGLDETTRQTIAAANANGDYTITTVELASALFDLQGSLGLTGAEITTYSEAFNKALALAARTDLNGAEIIADLNGINKAVKDGTMTAKDGEQAIRDLTTNYAQYSTALDGVTESQQKTLDSLRDLSEKGLAAARERLAALATDLGTMPNLLDAMTASGNKVAGIANGINDAGQALDTMTRIVIGNTDSIGQSAQSLADWATTMKDSGADAESVNTILSANTSIQSDLLDIQTKQVPVMANLAESQAEYIDGLSKLPAEQQLAALAMMDTTTATQAQELMMLAASAAAGELGTEGSAMAESLIIGAAEANPGLAAILESMGLISTTDGEVKVNFPNATSLAETLGTLQGSINDLVNATYMLIVAADPDDAFTDIDDVRAAVEGLPDGTVDIYANTSSLWNVISGIPQIVGDRYINIHGIGFTAMALGGMTGWEGDTAAMGRTGRGNMTLVGEAGPELVNLPGGSMVIPNHASRYMDGGKSGGVTFNGPITIVANDPQSFMRQMRNYSATMERR